MRLTDNRALHDYLTSLAALLRERGANLMADAVAAASRQASGLSTEFLGESRLALRKLVDSNLVALSDEDRVELGDVLEGRFGEFKHHRASRPMSPACLPMRQRGGKAA
jgi:hypothetical protein